MALSRNRFVAAMADRILILYAAPASKTETFCREILGLEKAPIHPCKRFESKPDSFRSETAERQRTAELNPMVRSRDRQVRLFALRPQALRNPPLSKRACEKEQLARSLLTTRRFKERN